MHAGMTPLRRSKQEIAEARKALGQMQAATSMEEYSPPWQTFLSRCETMWVKAERECQEFRNQFEPWQVPFKKLRKTDELLRYLYHARHVDQHTIQSTTVEILGMFALTIPPSGTVEVQFDEENGRVSVIGEHSLTPVQTYRYVLLPITNSGVVYNPPTEHLGQKLSRFDGPYVAELGLAFYEDFLRKVEAKFFSNAEVAEKA